MITGDLPGVWSGDHLIDDINIEVHAADVISSGALAFARHVDAFRGNGLPYYGLVYYEKPNNEHDLADLVKVMEHEFGHSLGLITLKTGTLAQLYEGVGTSDPRFLGANAVAQYSLITGKSETSVPLQAWLIDADLHFNRKEGVDGAHWREQEEDLSATPIVNELLSPKDSSPQTLSRLTIGALKDFGYTVNFDAADPVRGSVWIDGQDKSVSIGEGDYSVLVRVNFSRGVGNLPMTIDYETVDGSATASQDYVPIRGTLTYKPGVDATYQDILVYLRDDRSHEPGETFFVKLKNPTNAVLLDSVVQAAITILDDDPPPLPKLSIENATVTEGTGGTVNLVFTVRISAASSVPVTASFYTSDGTATAGSDYIYKYGTLKINAGDTTTTISVTILGDANHENKEIFNVDLYSAINADLTGVGASWSS